MAIFKLRSLLGLQNWRPELVRPVSQLSPFRSYSSLNDASLFGRIGFIGLGNMGSRMADNLIKAGHDVAVHDINHNVMKMFSDKGIHTEDLPLKVAETSDVVITMLPSSNHVLDVYTGQNGLLSGGNPLRPWLFIDSSTIDPHTSRKVSAAVSSCPLIGKRDGWKVPAMLDAPVSGGVLAAESGTLTFMVGGSEEAYTAAKALFLSMGKNTIYCGGSGNGAVCPGPTIKLLCLLNALLCLLNADKDFESQTAKICNNLAMAISMLGVSEAFALGQSLGIEASTLTKLFNSSSARCWSSDTYNPVPGVMNGVPSSRNYIGGFASKLMAKDLNLAAASAKDIGLKCPLTLQAETMKKVKELQVAFLEDQRYIEQCLLPMQDSLINQVLVTQGARLCRCTNCKKKLNLVMDLTSRLEKENVELETKLVC